MQEPLCHIWAGTSLPGIPGWHMWHPWARVFGVAHTAPYAMPLSAGWPPAAPRHSPREAGGAGRAPFPGHPQGGQQPRGGHRTRGLPWGGAALARSPSALAAPPPSGPPQQWLRFCCLRPARAGASDICKVQSSQHNSLGKYACNCKKVAQNFQTSRIEAPAPS